MFDLSRKEDALKALMSIPYEFDTETVHSNTVNAYGDYPILHIMKNDRVQPSMKMLKYAADWFEHPHPWGRDVKGECDFTAIRLVMALFENDCYNKLDDDVKASLEQFFLKRDFSSIYGSENHSLMFRAARMLAARFYKDKFFESCGMTAEEVYRRDKQYVIDFIDFRAGKGWGEFDSLGYATEIMLILNTVYSYTDDIKLKLKCRMAMDVILLDMMADSLGALYGGAHGRSYPDAIIDRCSSGMVRLYSYYFGGEFYNDSVCPNVITYISDYEPSPVLYRIAESKPLPYENRERKHLHCCSMWTGEILWDELAKVTGSINKYTYVCRDYILGAINRQEDYPENIDDKWYAHHQQHEWELTLPGGSDHKIFSHHTGKDDYHHINNRWTGDWQCCCGSFYANKNTAIAMYNIENKEALAEINAFVPLDVFSQKIPDGKYLFLEYGNLYISLYFDNGYRVNDFDEFAGRELISDGYQNAVVLRVMYKDGFSDISEFADSIKAIPVVFDRDEKTVSFDGIVVRRDGNSENGIENAYPYKKTYDCPFLQSDWDSKKIDVLFDGKKVTYDFENNTIID